MPETPSPSPCPQFASSGKCEKANVDVVLFLGGEFAGVVEVGVTVHPTDNWLREKKVTDGWSSYFMKARRKRRVLPLKLAAVSSVYSFQDTVDTALLRK